MRSCSKFSKKLAVAAGLSSGWLVWDSLQDINGQSIEGRAQQSWLCLDMKMSHWKRQRRLPGKVGRCC